MAAATSSATMAAAGFDKRPTVTVSSLPTPGSGTFPSELRSPMVSSPCVPRKEETTLRTPITPPSAYLDYLKSYSPAIPSPVSTTSARFSFGDKSFDRSFDRIAEVKSSSNSPPTSQPTLSRNASHDSNSTDRSTTSQSSAATETSTRPESPRVIIPPSQFVKPGPRSARTPRRLQIPQSPFSPALASAQSVPSPYSSTPLSAAPWSASFSPREHHTDISGPSGKVHVRQIVTRTVTYCRTPLDPAPKGKRRKISEADDTSSATSKASSEEPTPVAVKRELIERIEEQEEEEEAENEEAKTDTSSITASET